MTPAPELPELKRRVAEQYRDASHINTRIYIHEHYSRNTYGWHRWVFDQFSLPGECRVLELGCGAGTLWLENLGRVPAGWRVTLSDMSRGMLDDARASALARDPRFAFEELDAQAIPFAAGSFDAVIANHMLYHVLDRPKVFGCIQRVLKPGGRLYATANGMGHMAEMHELILTLNPDAYPEGRSEERFGLENGREQLAPWFADVEVRLYDDELVVPHAEPLIAYVRSLSRLSEAQLAQAKERVASEIRAQRAFRVTKNSGMFVARRA